MFFFNPRWMVSFMRIFLISMLFSSVRWALASASSCFACIRCLSSRNWHIKIIKLANWDIIIYWYVGWYCLGIPWDYNVPFFFAHLPSFLPGSPRGTSVGKQPALQSHQRLSVQQADINVTYACLYCILAASVSTGQRTALWWWFWFSVYSR